MATWAGGRRTTHARGRCGGRRTTTRDRHHRSPTNHACLPAPFLSSTTGSYMVTLCLDTTCSEQHISSRPRGAHEGSLKHISGALPFGYPACAHACSGPRSLCGFYTFADGTHDISHRLYDAARAAPRTPFIFPITLNGRLFHRLARLSLTPVFQRAPAACKFAYGCGVVDLTH